MPEVLETPTQPTRLLTYGQAAEMLQVPISTLYSLVCRRQVPHLRLSKRLVRFDRAALLDWLTHHSVAVQRVGEVP